MAAYRLAHVLFQLAQILPLRRNSALAARRVPRCSEPAALPIALYLECDFLHGRLLCWLKFVFIQTSSIVRWLNRDCKPPAGDPVASHERLPGCGVNACIPLGIALVNVLKHGRTFLLVEFGRIDAG